MIRVAMIAVVVVVVVVASSSYRLKHTQVTKKNPPRVVDDHEKRVCKTKVYLLPAGLCRAILFLFVLYYYVPCRVDDDDDDVFLGG